MFFFQEMTHNVRFTFSVGDIKWTITISYYARQIELVTLNTIFSVLLRRGIINAPYTK